ncbi:myo-inositol-1(or 4)-monophosphatase [Deinobacterium chartae]|uniref:Inositol-1-monophosphatase n=1 Tax=Deinobacterium chartae TaxID=521158 RepID=A0A841HWK0_9DEIO|nr:myo-inositol-1(or 4)-monophosphatase [Deinobacterium chartae]
MSETAFLETAVRAAKAAGALHLYYREQEFEVSSKTNFSDLVTFVDGEAERVIREVIGQAHPDHAVLGEEGGQDRESRFLWIVDPLDGTVNYAHGFPVSCVSIGLEVDGVRTVGVVFDPNRDELFTALRGGGAYLNGARIRVSKTAELLAPALLSTGFPYDVARDRRNLEKLERVLALGLPVRRPGAAALDLCYTACGRLDGYWEYGLKPWDAAAGLLILEEAGGRYSRLEGGEYAYGDALLCSNGHLHTALLEVLSA